MIDCRLGRWQDVLADVECDALICDPPYGARTHDRQQFGSSRDGSTTRQLGYVCLTAADIVDFYAHFAPRTKGWIAVFCCADLAHIWRDEAENHGRYSFAPLAVVQHGMNIRLAGDGPSNWAVWLVVSRPRTLRKWGTLPGAYVGNPFDKGENTVTASRRSSSVVGSKPLWLMRAIIGDYSRPGDLICDPCGGGFTTAVAAHQLGRSCITAECDPVTYAKAKARVDRQLAQPFLFDQGDVAVQERLL